ncbi:septum formation initiator family protein [Sinomonas sp. ASV486]|uniref:septum formation initiator family protein n=1 Tax=Sinomonas sp. ASV486 TaxID=3051170 RepID=UPI0027DC51D7|nr:septum formation initiator family protein [Sinomonas sp. ASV486]MDQ4490265.1 septum formation initiator family protein [Sinomonas sp. ASV486]
MATRRPAVPRTPATKRPAPSELARQDAAGPAAAKPTAKAMPNAQPPGAPKEVKKASRKAKATAPAKSKTQLRTPVPTDEVPVPARAFSGRIVALAVVLVAITIMLAPTVRIFIGQRAEISALQGDIAAKQAEQDSLRQSIARWQDQNYVKQQARDRINMVMPGETAYWVFGDTGAATTGTSSSGTAPASAEKPWTQGFWDSLVRAATD